MSARSKERRRAARARVFGSGDFVYEEEHCAVCGGFFADHEVIVHRHACPKRAYHLACLGYSAPPDTAELQARLDAPCPRCSSD